MDFLNIFKSTEGGNPSKRWKIISAVFIAMLFIFVTWYYNKDNDQTDVIIQQYESTE